MTLDFKLPHGTNMPKTKSALICGYYGNHNLGDEALLAGIICLLRKQFKDFSIAALSNDPSYTIKLHSVKGVKHTRPFQRRVGYILDTFKHPYFIFGGGDLLRDGVDCHVAQVWLRHLERAIQLRRKTLVLGISVGEIWRSETKAIIPKVLNKVDLIAVRDEDSRLKLQQLGVTRTIHIINDLALFALPIIDKVEFANHPSPKIGISVRTLNGRGMSVDTTQYPKFKKNMAAIADLLVEKYNAEIHLIPFHTYENSFHHDADDYVSLLETLQYAKYSEKMILHRSVDSLEKLNSIISQLDLMIGTRLHSLILASGLGIPIIGVEYDPKVTSFVQEVGQEEFCFSLEDFTLERVANKIEFILKSPLENRKRTVHGINQYRSKSQPFLSELSSFLDERIGG